MEQTLIRSLGDGPIDVVGDVHGELAALRVLLAKLGYDDKGFHPEGRKLVFVGDLGDRGPDSPGVVEWVRDRVLEGRAHAVLGNHDFNALAAAAGCGAFKTELSWLFDEARPFSHHHQLVSQARIRGKRRDDLLAFLRTLPVALERGGDCPVRVVHANWDQPMVERLRHRKDVIEAYRLEAAAVEDIMDAVSLKDETIRTLLAHNGNAVRRLTNGLEGKAAHPIVIGDTPRWEVRLPWWRTYPDDVLCVIGHYWRINLPGESKFEGLFPDLGLGHVHGRNPVMCIDYSVGKRFKERLHHGFHGVYRTRLAALRLPERRVYFDNTDSIPLHGLKV